MNRNGFILSTYVYMLLVFFLLLLVTMLAVLNNTKLLSNKLKEQVQNSSGLLDKEFSFVLLGNKNMVIRKDEEYVEPLYIAKTSKGKDIKDNVKVIGDLDTSVPNSYKLTYKLTYNGVTKKLERNIHVIDNIASTYIEGLYQYKNGENSLINPKVTYNSVEYDTGIRYEGANPNNYVYFNCKDEYTSNSKTIKYGDEDYVYQGNCEVWRIIGVFNTKSSDNPEEEPVPRIKIVRDKFSTNMSWDSSSKGTGTENNSGYGINQWGEVKDSSGNIIYEGSDLMRVLKYYARESSTCTYCSSWNQGTCPTSNNCASSVGQISSTSLEMVEDALWYTGATSYADTLSLSTMYAGERSTQSGKTCTSGNNCTDNVTRTLTWVGKIGLIYPSDYAYASTDESCTSDIVGSNSTCNTNNWLHPSSEYYWTISPVADSSDARSVWNVLSYRVSSNGANVASGVRPALYLASNVQIIGGDGTEGNPYKLGL